MMQWCNDVQCDAMAPGQIDHALHWLRPINREFALLQDHEKKMLGDNGDIPSVCKHRCHWLHDLPDIASSLRDPRHGWILVLARS